MTNEGGKGKLTIAGCVVEEKRKREREKRKGKERKIVRKREQVGSKREQALLDHFSFTPSNP